MATVWPWFSVAPRFQRAACPSRTPLCCLLLSRLRVSAANQGCREGDEQNHTHGDPPFFVSAQDLNILAHQDLNIAAQKKRRAAVEISRPSSLPLAQKEPRRRQRGYRFSVWHKRDSAALKLFCGVFPIIQR